MWQLAELDNDNVAHQHSYSILLAGLLLSAIAHVAVLAVEIASAPITTPHILAITIEKLREDILETLKPQDIPERISQPEHEESTAAAEKNASQASTAARKTPQSRQPLNLDTQQAIEKYMDSLPNIEGSDLEGRVFDPVLAAKIYEARKNSKARPGFGPGSYEGDGEHSISDPQPFVFSGGSSQRWVKVDGKCFLVHEETGLGPLRGAFDTWMRTSCGKFNPKFYDDR